MDKFNKEEHDEQTYLDEAGKPMLCDICGLKMASFTHIVNNDDIMIVCPGCRDKEEVRADYEYERQKEDDNPDHERDIREEL